MQLAADAYYELPSVVVENTNLKSIHGFEHQRYKNINFLFAKVNYRLKRSSTASTSLFKFGTDFKEYKKNNHEKLGKSENGVGKGNF